MRSGKAVTIPKGRDAAQSIGALAEASGQSRRAVERKLEEYVLSGVPIIACERGVYIAESAVEVRAYVESLRGRIRAVQGRISALEAAAERMGPARQETLWAA
jgi:hypothetical protein